MEANLQPQVPPPVREKLWSKNFITIIAVNFFLFLGFQLIIPVLPIYVQEIGGSQAISGFVVGIVSFTAVIARPCIGYLLDTLGRRGVIIASLAIFGATLCLQGFTQSLVILILLRAIQGLFWGASTTSTATVAADVIPAKRIGEGMGFFGIASSLSAAIGPPIGIYIMWHMGVRNIFFISAVFIAIAVLLLLTMKFIVLPPKTERRKGIIEKRALKAAILIFFVGTFYGAISSFIGTFIISMNLPHSNWYFPIYAFSLLLTRPLIGNLVDRKGYDCIILPGFAILAAAGLVFASTTNIFLLLLGGALFGLGFGTMLPSLQAMTVHGIEPNRRGAANSTYFIFYDSGIGLGALFFGMLLQAFGYSLSYILILTPLLLGALFFIAVKFHHKRTVA